VDGGIDLPSGNADTDPGSQIHTPTLQAIIVEDQEHAPGAWWQWRRFD
jgi:hypothetical protein